MALTSWEILARNHIPARSWDSRKRELGVAALGFDLSQMTDLSDVISPIISSDFENRESVSVFDFVGGCVAGLHDVAAILHKCAYVFRSVGNCLLSGQPSWASIEAYHFSLLAGRAFLAMLGIHLVQIKDTYCVLDVLPGGMSKQEGDKLRKQMSGAQEPARLIFQKRSAPLPQSAMWILVTRAIRITRFESYGLVDDLEAISHLGEGFGRSRNEMLYKNSSWIYEEDYERPTGYIEIRDNIHSYPDLHDFFIEQRDANFAFAAIFVRILLSLVSDIRSEGGVDLLSTSYGACFRECGGFDFTQLDAAFSKFYRKESYGIEI